MPDIYSSVDFRVWLREAVLARKAQDSNFTHRYICSQLGLATSNFLLLVMQGKRNLDTRFAEPLGILLGLDAGGVQYFHFLILFTQARTAVEKDLYWKELRLLRQKGKVERIQESQYEYYSKWYLPVLREVATMPGRSWDNRSLGQFLCPPVPAVQVRHGLELLESLGMIRREGEQWVKTSSLVATDPQVQSVAVFQYHQEHCELAQQALRTMNGKERNFSAVTMELSAEEYEQVVAALVDFRRRLLTISGTMGNPERIYHLNLQLFPVTQSLSSQAGGVQI